MPKFLRDRRLPKSDDADQIAVGAFSDGTAAEPALSPHPRLAVEERFGLFAGKAAIMVEAPHVMFGEHLRQLVEVVTAETTQQGGRRVPTSRSGARTAGWS